MACKGICSRKQFRPSGYSARVGGAIRYKQTGTNKVRRCQICEKMIKWDGLYCPCCGARLRLKARNKRRLPNLERIEKTLTTINGKTALTWFDAITKKQMVQILE